MNKRTPAPTIRIGIDIGGTFTDVVYEVDGRLHAFKLPSTAHPEEAVLTGLDRIESEVGSLKGAALFHGATVGTNAVLEGKGARVSLIGTEGFRDILEIGRQNRDDLYALHVAPADPLVPKERRFEAPERMGPNGVMKPLDEKAIAALASKLRRVKTEAVAVGLLHSYRDGSHERRVRDILQKEMAAGKGAPAAPFSLSCEIANEHREFERIQTAVLDAYIKPKVSGYLERLGAGAAGRGAALFSVMTSAGWSEPVEEARRFPVHMLLSGPAAGVSGACRLLGEMGRGDLITFDMGGTSTDVSLVRGGAIALQFEGRIGGRAVKAPMVGIETIGAGGGSLAWRDTGGALRVGPQSAGSLPGPACYGRGGKAPTVTDANVYLGYIPAGANFGGGIKISGRKATEALKALSAELRLPVWKTAAGIVRVADEHMTGALRRESVERGVSPAGLGLVAFGGAGPLHAIRLAEVLNMERVVVPVHSGMFSALGLIASRDMRHAVRPILKTIRQDGAGREAIADMKKAARDMRWLMKAGFGDFQERWTADARYKGQSHEQALEIGAIDAAEIAEAFHSLHEARFGYRLGAPVEIVNLRLFAEKPSNFLPAQPEVGRLTRKPPPAPSQPVRWLNGAAEKIPHYEFESVKNVARLEGPALLSLPGSALLLQRGWKLRFEGPFAFLARL